MDNLPSIYDYLPLAREELRQEAQQKSDYLFEAINANHVRAVEPSEGVERVKTLRRLGLC